MSKRIHLLDSNVLIALATPDHTAHRRALKWFQQGPRFATCPVTQSALIRFHMRWAVQPSLPAAKQLVAAIAALPNHNFWPDDLDFANLPDKGVVAHKHVTGAYLAALALAHKGALATMDASLAAFHPNAVLL
jgi:toxin-antitoxin system PIN domain toxin